MELHGPGWVQQPAPFLVQPMLLLPEAGCWDCKLLLRAHRARSCETAVDAELELGPPRRKGPPETTGEKAIMAAVS